MIERLKENYVYRYLLNNYEIDLKGKVDFGAWFYASRDMENIKAHNNLDRAYRLAKQTMEGKAHARDNRD